MVLAVQGRSAPKGRILLVNLGVSRPDNWIAPHQTGVVPAQVREMIREALAAGWNPDEQGSAFQLEHFVICHTIGR